MNLLVNLLDSHFILNKNKPSLFTDISVILILKSKRTFRKDHQIVNLG